MPSYHVGQTNLRIQLETNQNLIGSTVLVKYKKPNSETGQWAGTVTATTSAYYDALNVSDIDKAGLWYFWAHVTFGDSTIGIGAAAEQEIKEEGDG